MRFKKSILFIILSITLYQYVIHLPVTARYIVFPGDIVMSNDSNSNLASPNGIFTLGFFTGSSTNFTYLGIWYTNEIEKVKVWVANRNKPLIGHGVLMIDESGTLKLVNDGGGVIWFNDFYNEVGSGNNNTRAAVLEDSGNFLVYGEAENRTLWQSFDHPTDTLINGMKIGYNLTTKQNWTLTSSLSDEVMGSGAFTMRLEQYDNSPQLVIYRRDELYWVHRDPLNHVSLAKHYSLISDSFGMYLLQRGPISLTMQLSSIGEFINVGKNNMMFFTTEYCYGDEESIFEGCMAYTKPSCRSERSYRWRNGYTGQVPDNIDDNPSITIGDCMKRCYKDCDCGGCTTYINGTGCITWTRDVDLHNDFESSGLQSLTYHDYNGEPDNIYSLIAFKGPKIKKGIWILISLAGMLPFVLIVYLCCLRIQRHRLKAKEIRRRDDFIHQLIGSNSFNFGDELEKGFKDAPDVKIFSLKAILTATNNFSTDNKLGQGGYGPVYKGELFDGRKIAVKKLSKTSGQGILEFKSELILISKLQHTNLVRLYGCCIHHEEKMLIYELMPNKSLDFFLFDENRKEKMNWRIRMNIIEGVAQGLLYLHKYSRMRIIHRDLKVSNVLLDENMNPKIADFGMARIFQSNVTEGTTNRIVGTYGYMAPEYAMHGTFSIKSDIFSFGMLVIEIISGKKNSSFYKYDMSLTLVGYAWELWKREATLELKDISIGESYDVKQLLRSIHVGLLCLQENANDRPTMSEVIYMLNNENIDLPIPKQPAFYTQPSYVQSSNSMDNLLDNNAQVSVNTLTVTMEAR